jgi:hypothetical protein
MRLHAWSTLRRDIEFDPATGSATLIRLPAPRPDTSVPTGFADFERSLFGPRQVFALYRSGDALFFSAGARSWQLGQPRLRFVHSHPFPFFSRFRVLESDRVVFSILYSRVGRLLFALMDPTYDKLDEDSDFFLAFVAEYAQSPEWQANVRQRWASELHVSADG